MAKKRPSTNGVRSQSKISGNRQDGVGWSDANGSAISTDMEDISEEDSEEEEEDMSEEEDSSYDLSQENDSDEESIDDEDAEAWLGKVAEANAKKYWNR